MSDKSKHDVGASAEKRNPNAPTDALRRLAPEYVHDIENFRYPGDNVSMNDLLIPVQARRVLTRTISGRNADPSPIHEIGSVEFDSFVRDAYDAIIADESLAPTFDADTGCTGGNAVPTSFDQMMTDMTTFMNPQGFDEQDNTQLRSERGLNTISERCKSVAAVVLDVLLDDAYRVPIRYKKGSSAGAPTMERAKEQKRALIALTLNSEGDMLRLLRAGNASELTRKYMCAPVIVAGFRAQHEKADKVRQVKSPLLAYGIEDEGYPENADKHGSTRAGFHSARLRIVRGVPLGFNVTCAKYVLPFAEVMQLRYAPTFKNSTPETCAHILDKLWSQLDDPVLAAGDMVTYDATFPEELHQLIEERFSELVSADFAEYLRYTRSLPSYQAASEYDLHRYGVYGFLSGSVNDLQPRAALVSGHIATSLYGKLGTVVNHFCILEKMGAKVDRDYVRSILSHSPAVRGPRVYMRNGGDDHLLVGDRSDVRKYFEVAKADDLFFRVEPEENSVYLGAVYVRENGKFVGYPNIVTFVNKLVAPERAWNHASKTYWEVGLKSRLLHYADAPTFSRVMRHIDEAHTKHYGFSYSDYVHSLDGYVSSIDALFLANPDIVHYKIDHTDVSKEVYELIYANVPVEAVDYEWPIDETRFLSEDEILAMKESFKTVYGFAYDSYENPYSFVE